MPAFDSRPHTAAQIGAAMLNVAAEFGFRAVAPTEFRAVRSLAARRMKHRVSTCRTFRAVQAIQPASSLCFCEDGVITGLNGVLLLREAAVAQLMSGAFDGLDVDLELLARPGEAPAIGYGWGMAATTKPGGAAVIASTMPLRVGPLGAIPFVTNAVTAVGRHVSITRFGYRPLRGPDDNLLINDPVDLRRAA
jgi:hypothetical protein